MQPVKTMEMFNNQKRPDGFGPVTITFEEVQHWQGRIVRPISVYGLVCPCATSGRPSAKEPICGLRISRAKKVPAKYRYDPTTGKNYNNRGIIDMEKGHIMALELGGPDISENIVPQWAKWQGCGEWSQMESKVKDLAVEGQNSVNPYHVIFHCSVGYLKMNPQTMGGADLHRVCAPNHFTVTVSKREKGGRESVIRTFDFDPEQSGVDDKVALRKLVEVDRKSLGKDWEGYDDWVEQTDEKGRDTSTFVPSGQNPLYRGKKRPWDSDSTPNGGTKRSGRDSGPPIRTSTSNRPETPIDRSARRSSLNAEHRQAALWYSQLLSPKDLPSDDEGSDGEYLPGSDSEASDGQSDSE